MDAKLIEKLDRQRYWAVVIMTAAQLVGLCETILFHTFWNTDRWEAYSRVHSVWMWLGLPLLFAALVWYAVIAIIIVRKKELRTALHDEMYVAYLRRSHVIAFWTMICTWVLASSATQYIEFVRVIPIPMALFSQIIFWLGLFVLSVSWLILNRNRR